MLGIFFFTEEKIMFESTLNKYEFISGELNIFYFFRIYFNKRVRSFNFVHISFKIIWKINRISLFFDKRINIFFVTIGNKQLTDYKIFFLKFYHKISFDKN